MLTDAEVTAAIEPILSSMLAGSGLTALSVSSGDDHDGEPSLFVDVVFQGGGRAVDTDALVSAMVEARDALERQGERRFPYLKLHIPDPERDLAA